MSEKRPGKERRAGGGDASPVAPPPKEEVVPLLEGRFGAAWFVMLVGMMIVAYFYLNLVIFNIIQIKDVLDRYEGPSMWVKGMAPWLANNAMLLVLGSVFFLIGYGMTLRRRGRFSRERLLLRLFGVGTGFIALALLVLGIDYLFFLPKELKDFTERLDFFGTQSSVFLVWFAALSAITVCCWMPRRGGQEEAADH